MLNTKAKYGLKALQALASRGSEGIWMPTVDIARDDNIPVKFLEGILLDLKNHGIVHSRRGPGGGYALAKKPEAIIVGDIIRILNGPLAPVPCVSQTAYGRCPECVDERTCGVRLIMKEVRDAMSEVLDNTTLADLVTRVREASGVGEAFIYYI